MKLSFFAIVVLMVALTGCVGGPSPPPTQINQCLRTDLFKQCMAELPRGPDHTHYNDWDEVVEECNEVSAQQSYRQTKFIPPNCQ